MTQEKKQSETNVPAKTSAKLSTHAGFDPIIAKAQNYLDKLVTDVGFVFPKDYNPSNALMGAKMHLMLLEDQKGNLIIDQCTQISVLNALIEMCQKGLSVVKNQCYFIKYGDKLDLSEDYRGKLMIAKRDADVKDCVGHCVYKGDLFEYIVDTSSGRQQISKHEPKLENRKPENILGAYAVVTYNDGTSKAEVMTYEEIKMAWLQGGSKGDSPAHRKFPDQMSIRTVMNRAIKIDSGSSDDSEIAAETDQALDARSKVIKEKGGKKELNITDTIFEEVKDDKHAGTANAGKGDEITQADVKDTGDLSKIGDQVNVSEAGPEGPGY